MTDSSGNNPDPILLELFRAEVDLHLPVLSNGLLALEKHEADPKQIASMMRAAHSIKGAARIVGNDPAVRVSHALEDCLTAAKDHTIVFGTEAIDILLQAVDALARICTPDTGTGPDDAGLASILDLLSSVKEGRVAASDAAVITDAPASSRARDDNPLITADVTFPAPVDSISIPSELDSVAAESLRIRLCDRLRNPQQHVRLDFSSVGRVNVMLLALLLSFSRESRKLQPSPRIEATRAVPAVRALLRVVGLEAVFDVVD